MSDTNINAFEAEVQEAEKQLAVAQSNLDGAKQRLADKKVELGIVDEPSDEVETDGELVDEPVQSPDQGVIGDEAEGEHPVPGDVVVPTEPTKIEVQHES